MCLLCSIFYNRVVFLTTVCLHVKVGKKIKHRECITDTPKAEIVPRNSSGDIYEVNDELNDLKLSKMAL